MELNQFDIAVVGSFYNLSWLASELSRQGWNVLYLDMHSSLGRWPTEDIEGPFGFFNSELLSPHFVEKFNFEEPYVSQDRGWTLWTPQGPIEFKSPLISYQLNSLGINPKFIENLSRATEDFYKAGITSSFSELTFSQNWLEYLSHSLTQTEFSSYNAFKKSKYPLPLMNSFFIRELSRRSLDRCHSWLVSQNIKTSYSSSILDLIFTEGKKIAGFELKGDISGVIKANYLVWGLSSEETYFLKAQVGKVLFPKGIVEPEWVWSRYCIEIEIDRETAELPLHSVWINDLNAPWTHENLLIVQRTSREQIIDVWLKIPYTQRFNKDYLEYYGQKIIEISSKKFQGTKMSISHYPQEFNYTYQQLGPSRLVQFSTQSRSRRGIVGHKNIFLSSYETLESLNKETLYHDNKKIIENLTTLLKTEKARELE